VFPSLPGGSLFVNTFNGHLQLHFNQMAFSLASLNYQRFSIIFKPCFSGKNIETPWYKSLLYFSAGFTEI
jgi:hypothetical protein